MASNKIQFHKIWIDQCEATEGIRDQYGLQRALDYLVGEKLFSFVHAAEQTPEFAAELPSFVAEIRRNAPNSCPHPMPTRTLIWTTMTSRM
jgi:hypothetical protein